jgi:hypothetical protein
VETRRRGRRREWCRPIILGVELALWPVALDIYLIRFDY